MSRRWVVRFSPRLATDELLSMQETWNERAREHNEAFANRQFRTRRGAMRAISRRNRSSAGNAIRPFYEGVVPRVERLA